MGYISKNFPRKVPLVTKNADLTTPVKNVSINASKTKQVSFQNTLFKFPSNVHLDEQNVSLTTQDKTVSLKANKTKRQSPGIFFPKRFPRKVLLVA